MNKFPTELKEAKYRIMDIAREYGLDFYPIIFEVVDWNEMAAIAAYSGYPSRWHHWIHGMHYEHTFKEAYYDFVFMKWLLTIILAMRIY